MTRTYQSHRPFCAVELCEQHIYHRHGDQASPYCAFHHSAWERFGDPVASRPSRAHPLRELPAVSGPSELGRILGISRQRAHQLLFPDKRRARTQLNDAVAQGRIFKPPFCLACGEHTEALEAHHWDYDRPLDVGWFCVPCHNRIHPHPNGMKKG